MKRSPIQSSRPIHPIIPANSGAPSFASALKGTTNIPLHASPSPAMVLDDSCVVPRELDNFVMGEVKQFSSINNLRVFLSNEGFPNVKLAYLGGLWVMIELESLKTKTKFMQHVGVASWFLRLCNAQSDFVSRERIVWVDIEGVPIHAWSHSTFHKIGSKWGEVMELEECKDDMFARKRICIKTKQEENILEKFKIIVHRKIFVVRAEELFVWSPIFNEVKEVVYCTDDESVKGGEENNEEGSKQVNLDDGSDVEGVSETYFGESEDNLVNDNGQAQPENDKESSYDPFNIYSLLKKRDEGVVNFGVDTNIPFPPGFTPKKDNKTNEEQEVNGTDSAKPHSKSDDFCSRVVEDAQSVDEHLSADTCVNGTKVKKGGSILEILDDMIKVGHTMGFSMEGCLGSKAKKDWVRELNIKYKVSFLTLQETKMESISVMDVKTLWGNYCFEYLFSEALGLVSSFLHISAICLDRHLSDHRPILLRDVITDYGATPFWLYHSCLGLHGFDQMVTHTWNSTILDDRNGMIQLKKKLQILKKEIRTWVMDHKQKQSGCVNEIKSKLCDIDKFFDQGGVNDEILLSRKDLMKQMQDIKSSEARDCMQKAKIQWAIEGDENSKFFHGIINRKRANLSIKGIMVDGEWVDDPNRVKEEFRSHFATRFQAPVAYRSRLNFQFPYRLNNEQAADLENSITRDEIRNAIWGCGENKSPGPDGFTFEFFHKFWNVIGADVCVAVEWFFDHSSFSKGCNSSFVALIPKIQDPKFVNDYRPISLIGSLYKVVTKVLANRLSSVISDLILDVQTAFLPNRQILDGPFIINELLSWCKYKKQQAMVFKVDFAKAYDSIRWDYLDDVLNSFGFGSKWRSWISGSLFLGMASILINGSPTSEFQSHCGLKQGDPLAPYLFILVMESLNLSFLRVVDAGMFRGIRIDSSLMISHLFYADDVVFIGEWSDNNLTHIMRILHCFFLASELKINLKKCHLLGVGVPHAHIIKAAMALGSSVVRTHFKYLGVVVGGNMSLIKAWDETIGKLKSRLSRWKLNALSIGGRLTLLKLVLGSTPIYIMSLYKVPKSVLNLMESIRRNFFNGIHGAKKRISWVKWSKVLAAKKNGGLGVSSYYALNRALLFKWVWRIRVGNGLRTRFWSDKWVDDTHLRHLFPRVYALEVNKECSVADKLQGSVTTSFRRSARGGIEAHQLAQLQLLIEPTILSNSNDRWGWDLNVYLQFKN
ncbi:RNA-directed DNA polymerase, eukaryota [Tanacetum coccineum]